jgi:hypothetical protein
MGLKTPWIERGRVDMGHVIGNFSELFSRQATRQHQARNEYSRSLNTC